jgi:predicted alpha-1,2-mannosidase
LEYAYDDWTIYKFAEKLGRTNETNEFLKRANNFKNIFDTQTKFMRAKNSDGTFKISFDPLSVANQGYIEGNAWNYSLYVPQDINGFIKLIGGKEKLVTWLDSLFTFELPEKYFGESEDVTKVGMIGNYVHGNEPSHHVPYMYCYAGQPWKTQERIHQIINSMYKPEPHGLCGNDDCGQMSAWYIFSAIGFYPVTPGSNEYVIGSPCVEEAKINLEDGKTFLITAVNLSEKNIYIKEVYLNGEKLDRCFITHNEILNGGELKFVMQDKPNKNWAVSSSSVPYSLTN